MWHRAIAPLSADGTPWRSDWLVDEKYVGAGSCDQIVSANLANNMAALEHREFGVMRPVLQTDWAFGGAGATRRVRCNCLDGHLLAARRTLHLSGKTSHCRAGGVMCDQMVESESRKTTIAPDVAFKHVFAADSYRCESCNSSLAYVDTVHRKRRFSWPMCCC